MAAGKLTPIDNKVFLGTNKDRPFDLSKRIE